MKKRQNHLKKNENLAGFLFVLPGLIGFIIFVFLPMLFSLGLSMTEWSFTAGFKAMRFVGLDNFLQLASDYKFIASAKNTLIFTFATVPVILGLGLILSVLIQDYVIGKNVARTLLFIPYVSSVVAVSIVWVIMFHPSNGPINEMLKSLGIANPPKWFGDVKWALAAIVLQTIWLNLGYYIVVLMAGLTNIPKTMYEAAEIDGAGAIGKFFNITIPGVSPTLFFLLIIGIINSFKVFDQIMITTDGGPGTATLVFSVYVYKLAFQNYRMGYASAVAMIMFVVIFAITLFQFRQQRKYVSYMA